MRRIERIHQAQDSRKFLTFDKAQRVYFAKILNVKRTNEIEIEPARNKDAFKLHRKRVAARYGGETPKILSEEAPRA